MKLDIKSAIQQFLIDQEIKGNTPKTILFYDKSLRYFVEVIGADKQVEEIVMDDLKMYHQTIKNRPKYQNHAFKPTSTETISTISIQTYIRALRAFLRWLFNEGYVKDDLSAKFKLPKAIKKTIEILSDEEIETVIKRFKTNSELSLRNLCICALMVDCGLRANEALTIDVDNVHITQGVVKVLGKGQKERIVPMGLFTKKLLLKYISGYRSMPVYNTKRLFLSSECGPMSMNALKMMFTRLKKRTKIDRLHPHMLRHTFATRYLMNGGDIFSLQQILGHTSLEMVRKYSHLASAYVVHKHKLYSPLDNLYGKKQ